MWVLHVENWQLPGTENTASGHTRAGEGRTGPRGNVYVCSFQAPGFPADPLTLLEHVQEKVRLLYEEEKKHFWIRKLHAFAFCCVPN